MIIKGFAVRVAVWVAVRVAVDFFKENDKFDDAFTGAINYEQPRNLPFSLRSRFDKSDCVKLNHQGIIKGNNKKTILH